MTAGYDEWAAARTPALLAFALALTDDVATANAGVARALARTRAAWPRVSRDDPDLVARRHVLRVCSSSRRAAGVLRLLEERSDAEIAEILHCSESAARRHVERGLAELSAAGRGGTDPITGDPPRAMLGASSVALVSPPPPVLTGGTGRSAPPRRHRGPWLAAGAVLLLVGGVALVAHETRTPGGVISYPRVSVPDTWRYESYAGVQLEVPDTWGWGGAPIRASYFEGPRHLGSCGANQAAVLSPADHSSYVSPLTRFVGRPAMVAATCTEWGSDGTLPEGEAVWFGSPLKAGVKDLPGTVAETRQVGAQRVTVFAPGSALRRQILGTAQSVDVDGHGCPTQVVARPTAGPTGLRPTSMSVCVYSQDTGVAMLLYSTSVSATAARRYAEGVASATSASGGSSCLTPSGQWVALGLHDRRGTRWDVANLRCDRLQLAGERTAGLTVATVRDWAVAGVPAYVVAPRGGHALDDLLRAPRPY
jgi:hypothetical protein